MRKESSKNRENELTIQAGCGMAFTLALIGGRWKPSLLWQLTTGPLRYNQLKKSLPSVSERVLVLQLREMEQDGLINRIIYAEVPPRVEYSLTDLGASLEPLLQSLSHWGELNRPKEPAAVG